MKKLTNVLIIALVLFGISSTANALQIGNGYSGVDLHSFNYTAGTQEVYARDLGWYSAGYALAIDQNDIDSDSFEGLYFDDVLNDWAGALTANALRPSAVATAGTTDGWTYSSVEAAAGYDATTDQYYGTYSGALAKTSVSAYEFFVAEDDSNISFNIDYYLESTISGDEPGFALAGAGAMLAIYQMDGGDDQGRWLSMDHIFGIDQEDGTLSIVLEGLQAGSTFSVFAGTAALAMAYAPGGDTSPVPEPATLLLLGTGLIGIAGVSRRKITKK